MKFAVITDTHFGAREANRAFLDYFVKFYREVFFPELKARGIKRVFHLGDIVDKRKYINFVILNSLRKEFIEAAKADGIELDIIVGNHDIPYRDTNEINAINEAFQNYDHIRLYSTPEEIDVDGLKILMMPWINNKSVNHDMEVIKNSTAPVMFGHLEIKGFEMYRGLPSHSGFDASVFDKFEVVASGHFHKKSVSGNINYLGAPYQITWSDYNCPRGFHIFDTDTKSFEYIRNPYDMFHKVFYDDEGKTLEELLSKDYSFLANTFVKVVVRNKTNAYWFDTWLEKIYTVGPQDVSIVDDHRHMDTLSDDDLMHEAEDTLTILTKYVANMELKVNKEALDNLMRDLYNEAMDLEASSANA